MTILLMRQVVDLGMHLFKRTIKKIHLLQLVIGLNMFIPQWTTFTSKKYIPRYRKKKVWAWTRIKLLLIFFEGVKKHSLSLFDHMKNIYFYFSIHLFSISFIYSLLQLIYLHRVCYTLSWFLIFLCSPYFLIIHPLCFPKFFYCLYQNFWINSL